METDKKWYEKDGGVVALLFLFFPVGLFLMWKYSGWKPLYKWGVTIFIASMLFLNLSGNTNNGNKPTAQTITQPIVTQQEPIKDIFGIPSLVGKNIDEIRMVLGQPADKELEPNQAQINLGATEWSNSFMKDGKELLVTYNVKSRKVVDFFIDTNDPSGQTKDKQQLLKLNNLTENDPRYKIEFVKVINNPTYFTGVKIIPQ